MAEFNVRISQEQLQRIRRDIVKAFTPKETPVPKYPETSTEWLEDIALELHAITGLLNERLPEVKNFYGRSMSSFIDRHGIRVPEWDGAMQEPSSPDTDDDPDEALAAAMWDSRSALSFSAAHASVRADYIRMARAARQHILGGPDDEPMGSYRRRDVEALRERAERAEAERDSALQWRREQTGRAEEAEAELQTVKTTLLNVEKRRDALLHERYEPIGLLREAKDERDEWKAKFEQADTLLSRTRDECDKYADRAERWAARHAALREDVEACRNACQIEDILARDDKRGGEQS